MQIRYYGNDNHAQQPFIIFVTRKQSIQHWVDTWYSTLVNIATVSWLYEQQEFMDFSPHRHLAPRTDISPHRRLTSETIRPKDDSLTDAVIINNQQRPGS